MTTPHEQNRLSPEERAVKVTATDREHLEHQTADALVTQNYGPPASDNDERIRATNYQKIRAVLPKYSDETLRRFIAAADTDLCWSLETYLCTGKADEEYTNDWIVMEPTALSKDIDSVPVLRGLTQYKHLTPQNNGHYPTRRAEQVIAITRVTAHLAETRHGLTNVPNDELEMMKFIKDEQLRNLLTTHDDPAAVADIIINRSITDAGQIVQLLEGITSTASAISDGTL